MKNKTKEFKLKATQSYSTKIELMRDLATYEVNYSDVNYFEARMAKVSTNF